MKKISLLIAGGMLFLGALEAKAQAIFEADHAFQVFSDSRWKGTNRNLAIGFDLGADAQVSIIMQEGLWDWRGDVGAAVPNFVNVTARINGIRVMKTLSKFLAAGIGIGTAEVTIRSAGGTTATAAAAAPLAQTKPVLDILGRASYSVSSGKIDTGLHLDLGYRFLDLNDVTAAGVLAAAGSGEATLDDLNSMVLAIGLHARF